jgi:hypothetical protein
VFSTRIVKTSVVLVAIVAALVLAGCGGNSRAPLPESAAPTPAETTTQPSASATTAPSASTVATPASTDSEGGAIGKPVTITKGKKPQVGKVAQPSDSQTIAQAKKLLASDQGVSATKVVVEGRAQDKAGTWWILLTVTDSSGSVEKLVLTYDGKAWDDPVYGDQVTTTDLPPGVGF